MKKVIALKRGMWFTRNMNTKQLLEKASEIFNGFDPYEDDGTQQERAIARAVDEAGIPPKDRAAAITAVTEAWAAADAAAEASPEAIAARQADIAAEEKAAAEKAAAEAAEKANAEEIARRRAIGNEIDQLTGSPSDWFFVCRSGQGVAVASPNGGQEVVVAVRVEVSTMEDASEVGKFAAWGIPLSGDTKYFWEATPEGEVILAEWKARQARRAITVEKWEARRKARQEAEKARARAAIKAELEAAKLAREQAKAARRNGSLAQPAASSPEKPAAPANEPFGFNPFANLNL